MSYRSNRESGENMKKKKIFALAMAGCMLFTQPALAEELQEGIDDAIVIPEEHRRTIIQMCFFKMEKSSFL